MEPVNDVTSGTLTDRREKYICRANIFNNERKEK